MIKIKDILKFINPFKPLVYAFRELNESTSTNLISARGYEVLSNPRLKAEMEIQMEQWRAAGGGGVCVVDLSRVTHLERNVLIEKC